MTDQGKEMPVEELGKLLDFVLKNSYRAKDSDTQSESLINNCFKLFGQDYKYIVLGNSNGELCSHYPTRIPILEYVISGPAKKNEDVQSMYDLTRLREIFNKAKFARCRARFAVPVILYEGKHICRAATISGGVEIYGRSGFDFFFSGGENIPDGEGNADTSSSPSGSSSSSEWQLFNRIRGQDIKLLKTFSIGYICDLMVEKKKVKFGMNITSSEKVDKENRYSDFSILSVPYPGCEFFREWRENGYMAEGMMFDWNQGYVDALLDLPGNLSPPHNIDWSKYRRWDLVTLTQNYLSLLQHYIKEGDGGMLIHCISGWDRTPLFISLLRLSMWADGAIHHSLGPVEILYLTIAYDWFLFGHNFPDRIGKGEEVFFFCFNFLKYITSEEFSVTSKRPNSRAVSRTDSECNMDSVLLDPDQQRASYRGSNTSISSASSLNSTKSSVDNGSISVTMTAAEGNGTYIPNGNACTTGVNPTAPSLGAGLSRGSAANNKFPMDTAGGGSCRIGGVASHFSSSPMAVPHNIHRVQENRANSPACGSWQIISGTGSFRGSTSSPESIRSSVESSHNVPCDIQEEETTRKQRLDAVRRIFLSVYSSTIDFKITDSAGGFGGLLDQFAEKVGIRPARSTPV